MVDGVVGAVVKVNAGLALATPAVKALAATLVGDKLPAIALSSDSVTALEKLGVVLAVPS
jgi:hypothetical protein